MSGLPLSTDTTVARALESGPAVQGVFLTLRTACVGCSMARFCTLRDTAQAYGLRWETFISKLKSVAPDDASGKGGTSV